MTVEQSTYDTLLKLVKTRQSVRKFRPDPIPEDTINKILEVARWAMSGANSQPWEFVVVTDREIKKQLRDAYSDYIAKTFLPTNQVGSPCEIFSHVPGNPRQICRTRSIAWSPLDKVFAFMT